MIAFFGTSQYSVQTLDILASKNIKPGLIITTPDKKVGRGLKLTPPPVKIWAEENNVPFLQPENLKDEQFLKTLRAGNFDVFIVIAYGKIIPQEVIDIPRRGALNIHASILPKYRGASPIESQILADEHNIGVTVMQIDAEMDHGSIVAQQYYRPTTAWRKWPMKAEELGHGLVKLGSQLLVEILSDWLEDKIEAKPQDHTQATYTKKITKEDGLIDLSDEAYKNYLKIKAFSNWPGTYFFIEKNGPGRSGKKIRVIIKKARYENGVLYIERVVPEGKKEMDYAEFKRVYLV